MKRGPWGHSGDYFATLIMLLWNWKYAFVLLDTPLDLGVSRTRWFVGWSAAVLCAAFFIVRPDTPARMLHALRVPMHALAPFASRLLEGTTMVVATLIMMAVLYGLLRLYTLIAHNMITGVLKSRGQRLRLLNLETSLLPLSVPMALALATSRALPVFCCVLVAATFAYGIWILVAGYSVVFHKSRLGALSLLVSSTLLAWFILAIGAFAVAVAAGVIGFFVLLFLRIGRK